MEITPSLLLWRIGGIIRNRWLAESRVNSELARGGAAECVTEYAFDVAGDRITRIWATSDPDKLRLWTMG